MITTMTRTETVTTTIQTYILTWVGARDAWASKNVTFQGPAALAKVGVAPDGTVAAALSISSGPSY